MEPKKRIGRSRYIRTFLCDRCGAEVKPDPTSNIIVDHERLHLEVPLLGIKFIRAIPQKTIMDYPCVGPRIHLCPECLRGLNRYLDGEDLYGVPMPKRVKKGVTDDE